MRGKKRREGRRVKEQKKIFSKEGKKYRRFKSMWSGENCGNLEGTCLI